MPALRCPLRVEAGSYDPVFWEVRAGDTGALVDLTQPGYLVAGAVNSHSDGSGAVLLDLPDDSVWRRTSEGRVYFEPHSVATAAWTFQRGYYQAELSHPSGETVRILEGPFSVSPELVT